MPPIRLTKKQRTELRMTIIRKHAQRIDQLLDDIESDTVDIECWTEEQAAEKLWSNDTVQLFKTHLDLVAKEKSENIDKPRQTIVLSSSSSESKDVTDYQMDLWDGESRRLFKCPDCSKCRYSESLACSACKREVCNKCFDCDEEKCRSCQLSENFDYKCSECRVGIMDGDVVVCQECDEDFCACCCLGDVCPSCEKKHKSSSSSESDGIGCTGCQNEFDFTCRSCKTSFCESCVSSTICIDCGLSICEACCIETDKGDACPGCFEMMEAELEEFKTRDLAANPMYCYRCEMPRILSDNNGEGWECFVCQKSGHCKKCVKVAPHEDDRICLDCADKSREVYFNNEAGNIKVCTLHQKCYCPLCGNHSDPDVNNGKCDGCVKKYATDKKPKKSVKKSVKKTSK